MARKSRNAPAAICWTAKDADNTTPPHYLSPMATLYFKVGADYDKVIRLREEIKKLKAEMASFDGSTPARTVSQTQKQLNSTNKEYEKMLNMAARSGDEMQNGYRKSAASLSAAQKNVDLITGRMIEQKAAVANLQSEVRRLAEAYRMADAGNKKTANKQLSSAKSRLEDERVALNKLRSSQESARLTVKGLRDDVSGYERVLRQSISTQADANSSFAKLKTMMIGAFTIQQAGQFIKSVAEVRGQFQQLEVAFNTMLGSKAKADALMAQVVETAAKTPFDLQGVANGAKQLLAYGVASEQVNETLIRLGNISAGLSIPLGDLVYLYGTTMTQGRLFTQDLRQFMGRGIPLADELAKQFGVTKDQVGALVTAGKVGFPEVQRAIEAMTGEGGKFYNLMEAQSKTITGQISNLGDAWDTMLNEIGKSSEGAISTALSRASYLVEHYDTVGKIIAGLIATYGAWKAAIMVHTALTKTYALYDIASKKYSLAATLRNIAATKIQIAQQLLLNKAMLANPYVLLTVGVVALGAAIWALHDGTTAEEKAQQKLNDELAQAKQRKQDLISKAESLIGKINSETESVYGQVKAYQELIKLFPELKGMTFEEFKSMPEGQQSKKVNEIAEKRELNDLTANYNEALEKAKQARKKYQDYLSTPLENGITPSENGLMAKQYKKQYAEASAFVDLLKSQLDEATQAQWEANTPLTEKIRHYETVRDRLLDERAQLEQVLSSSQDTTGEWQGWSMILNGINGQLDEANGKIKGFKQSADTKTWGKTEWDKQLKEASDSINKIPIEKLKLLKLGPEIAARKSVSKDDINSYQKLIGLQKAAKESLKTYEEPKGNSDALRKRKQLNNALVQADLDLQLRRTAMMREGKEKRLAEIDLEHRQVVAKINNDRAAKKADGATDIQLVAYDKLSGEADAKRIHDRAQVEKQYASELTETYRQLADMFVSEEERKTQAIEQKYQGMRNKAVDDMLAGNIDGEEFIAVNTQIDAAEDHTILEAEADKYRRYAQERLRIEQQFQNDVKQLREQNPNGGAEGEIEQRRAIANSDISAIATEMGVKEGEFTSFVDSVINRGIDELLRMISEAQSALDALGESGDPVKKTELSNRIKVAKIQLQNQKTETKQSANSDPAKKWKDTLSVMNDVKGITSDVISNFEGLDDATAAILNAAMNIATGVVNMIIGITTLAVSSATATTTTATVAGEAIKGVEKASLILAVISAALQVAQAIASLFVKDHELSEQTIKSYEAYMDVTDQLIDQQKELMEVITGVQAVMAGEEGLKAIEKQEAATRKLGKAYLASRAKNKHSYGVKTEEQLRDDADAINAAGFDWGKLRGSGRMEGLFDLSAEEILRFQRELSEVWSQLDDDTRKYLQTIVDCKDKSKELSEALGEALTGFTLDDARSELIDFLNDADSTFEDVAENFEKTMMNSINRVIASGADEGLKNWYKHVQDALSDEDGLTGKELEDLRKEREDIYKKAAAERDAAYKIAGIDPTAASSDQKSAKGGFETMSQDTGEELNGRFTAIQMSTHEILNLLGLLNPIETKISAQIASLLVVNTQTRDIADEIRTIQVNSFLELQQIGTHTRSMDKILKLIHSDLAQVNTNTANL